MRNDFKRLPISLTLIFWSMFAFISMAGVACEKPQKTKDQIDLEYQRKYATGKEFDNEICIDSLLGALVVGMPIDSFVKKAGKATSAKVNAEGYLALSYVFNAFLDTFSNIKPCQLTAKFRNVRWIDCHFQNGKFVKSYQMNW